jgi:anti-sigma factor RsiW
VGLLAAASLFGLMIGGSTVYWGFSTPKPQTPSVATANWLDNIAGYHRLITMAATGENVERAFDAPANADAGKIASRLPQGGLPKVPDLKPWGLTFEGARYLVVEGRPAAQLFYKSDNKNLGPLTVVVASSKRQDVSPTFERRDDVNMLYWRRGGKAYAVAGQADKGWLWGLANDIGWQLNAI